MKKAKRMMAAVMAAGMMFSTIPATANAVYIPSDDSYLEGFTKIERGQYSFLEHIFAYHNNEVAETYFVPGAEVYLSNTDTRMIVKNVAHYSLCCEPAADTTETMLSELMKKTGTDFDIITYNNNTQFCIRIKAEFLSNAELRSIKDTLKTCVTDISLRYNASNMEFGYRDHAVAKDFLTFYDADADKAEEYLTEKGIAFTTEIIENEFSKPVVKLIPEKEMSQWEKAALYDEFINTTELQGDANGGYGWGFPESMTGSVSETISIFNYTDGDANCDDKLTVSDAVAVLQYIVNREKYPMSEQGRFNADIDGEEGITGGDAIAIQKIDAGIWDES